MADLTTPVSELRDAVRRFVADRAWEPFHSPKNLAMALVAEAAELMEHFLWMDDAESHRQMQEPARREQVADEIADVVGVCLSLCNVLDLDLSDISRRKMVKNERKYPVDRARGRYRLDDAAETGESGQPAG
ncbi:MAG: nucleotide pyrophosphohydrolase [Gemmataceae bacterium]